MTLSRLTIILGLVALTLSIGVALHLAGWIEPNLSSVSVTAEFSFPYVARGAEAADDAKRDQIRAEVEMLAGHPWAGEYRTGGGPGASERIVLAPKAGYAYELHGCLGLYDRKYGSVSERDGKLTLSFKLAEPSKGLGIAKELTLVRWGDRTYLIPSDDMVHFCNRVNQGAEPRSGVHGWHFLRVGDEGKPVTGPPEIPTGFRDYLLPQPVEATVTVVGPSLTTTDSRDWKREETRLTFDAGKKRGLKVGMELVVTEPDNVWQTVTITEVEDDRSEGVITQWAEKGDKVPGPKAGWRLSTRRPPAVN